jgi:hypothetical protein
MKYIAFLLILLATSPVQASLFNLGGDGPGGFSVWHNDHWDHLGVHVDSPQSVPEPGNPIVLLAAAGAVLLMRRKRN